MEKSFSLWRESKNFSGIENDSDDSSEGTKTKTSILVYDSDNETDSVVVGSSHSKIDVPDSDDSFICRPTSLDKNVLNVVPDSDEQISSDEDDSNNFDLSSGSGIKKSHRKSINNSNHSYYSSLNNKTLNSLNIEESSPEVTKSVKRKNKKFVISSDEESCTEQSKNFNISDVFTDEESNSSTSGHKEERIIEKEKRTHLIRDSCDNSENTKALTKDKHVPNTLKPNLLSTVDLTLPIKDDHQRKGVITISSESEDDNHLHSHQSLALENQRRAQSPKKDKKEIITTGPLKKTSENDYSSRLDSLKAEQTKLDVQVKEILRNIETIKSTLKTANMAALPDKGVRLKINLKKFESQLRDLRYQQSTLSNEIIRLQLMSGSSNVPKPQIQPQPQLSHQKMYKLPTTTTDINTMGKKAMETHRTQQALTVDALRALHNSLKNCPSEDALSTDPEGLKVELLPHQKYALSWLMWREREKPSGGILADDMGLGKTLTMISLILKSNEKKHEEDSQSEAVNSDDSGTEERNSNWLSTQRPTLTPGKTLVVCPASLLGQWENEVQRRVRRGTMDVIVHHGQNREKKARRLAKPDLVITTYNIVSRDSNLQENQSPLFQIKWERVILDEAHQIRNHKTQTAQAVFQLKARSRWVLTGTPVQNKELDLYALLRFLRCSPFDDLGVWKTWVDNRDAAGQQRLNTIIKSIMLRRTKKGLQEVGQLKSLPEKKFNTVFITMDKEEWAVYEKLLNFSKTLFAQFLHQKAEKENALQGIPLKPRNLQHVEDPFKDHPELARLHRQMKEISDVKSHHILVLLLRLRQFCCHPSLIQSMLEKDDISNVGIEDSDGLDVDLMDKMTRMSIVKENVNGTQDDNTDLTAMDLDNPLFAKDRISSKLRKVLDTMEGILSSNDKILVVSQWVSHLDLVHKVLQDKNIKCLRLTGQVAVKDRAEIVDKFNKKNHGPKVLLLSLTAGGVGLNLVGANHLLMIDLHWNPQLENQACDRIYRVGQEKNVNIYKFVTCETVEESVLKLQEGKLSVADSVLTGSKHTSKLTLDDLKELFKIK